MADRDRIRFLTGFLDNLNTNLSPSASTKGQVYFGIDGKESYAKIRFDVAKSTDSSTILRLPIYTDYADKAGEAGTASDATQAQADDLGNKFSTTYISELKKGDNKTSLLYKRPGEKNYTTIDLEFLPLAGGTLTGAVTGTTITATSFVGPLTGNATTATALQTPRSITTDLGTTTQAKKFDGSADYVTTVSGTLGVANGGTGVTTIADIQAGKDGAGNTITSTYLKLAGGTMTGTIKWEDSGKTVPFLEIGSVDKDTTVFRIHDKLTDGTNNLGSCGYTLKYLGTGSGNNNTLALYTDNQQSDTQIKAIEVYQDGTVTFAKQVTGTSGFKGNLDGTAKYATNDAEGNEINKTYLTNVYTTVTAGSYVEDSAVTAETFVEVQHYTKNSDGTYSAASSYDSSKKPYYIKNNDVVNLYKQVGTTTATNPNAAELVTTIVPLDSNGKINLKYIPQAAQERLVTVANIAARNALTTADVQKGDTVRVQKQEGKIDNLLYIVVDTNNLGNDAGYVEYAAGTAAAVDWSDVLNRPTVVGTGEDHNPIVLNSDKITYTVYKVTAAGSEESYTIAPQFLPLAGGHVNGSTTIDDLTAGDLLVTGAASFNNTIKGNIDTATKLLTGRQITTDLGSTSQTKTFDGSANYVTTVSGVLGVANGGTGNSSWTKGQLIYSSDTTALANTGSIYTDGSHLSINYSSTNASYNLYVAGTTNITSNTTIGGTTSLSSTLTVDGATTLKSSLTVAGATTIAGTTTANGALVANSSFEAQGGATITNSGAQTSADSQDNKAALVVTGGISVSKQLSANTVRIDDGATSNKNGCTLTYNDTYSCLEFVFS